MARPDPLLHDLNPAQREAVQATTGPVCILAGAGTGKTRVIARRVAVAIREGVVHPGHVLVVTFTDKAAGEMRERLAGLGLPQVRAATFHAAALAQLRYFWPRVSGGPVPDVLDSKASLLAPLIRTLPGGYRFLGLRDLAEELEWAKVRRVPPAGYAAAATGAHRTPPLPPDLFTGLYARYERAKERAGRIDFEDMLERTIGLFADPGVADEVRGRYRWFSVDEFQDTNPLQHDLLEAWLGDRDDLAVVGDPDQAIYTFTGATSRYLTGFTRRFPAARVVRLEQNYRSSPQVLRFANRLLAGAGAPDGRPPRLTATRREGPDPQVVAHVSAERELAGAVAKIRQLTHAGVPLEEIAVLVRTNAQIPPFEDALAEAGIGYTVRGEPFFRRGEVRRALALLRRRTLRAAAGGLLQALEGIWFEQLGFRRELAPDGEEAQQRHASLVALLGLAEQLVEASPEASVDAYLADLARRAEAERSGSGAGVNLLTLHRAKGLEFDAVLLPGLEEGLVPIRQASSPDEVAEERRVLYVGISRARRHLWCSWAARRPGTSGRAQPRQPSRFLDLLVPAGSAPPRPRVIAGALAVSRSAEPVVAEALRTWRRERAARDDVPAYVVFNDRTLAALAQRLPRSPGELLAVEGIGPSRLERYGDELLAVLRTAS